MSLQQGRPNPGPQSSCALLHTQRNTLRKNVTATGTWLPSKEELIAKYLKPFLTFTKSIDFEQL
jgi:hypothetical protein